MGEESRPQQDHLTCCARYAIFEAKGQQSSYGTKLRDAAGQRRIACREPKALDPLSYIKHIAA